MGVRESTGRTHPPVQFPPSVATLVVVSPVQEGSLVAPLTPIGYIP